MRRIKTAWSLEEINYEAIYGNIVLIRPIVASPKFNMRVGIFQHKVTKQIEMAEAYVVHRQYTTVIDYGNGEWDLLVNFFDFYPYYTRPNPERFSSPVAAYIVPPDITIGEVVIIDELIEDYYGGSFWSSKIRLDTLPAIWDGHDLKIQYVPGRDDVCHLIG